MKRLFKKSTLKVFHPESPGVHVYVRRNLFQRFVRPKAFATLEEAIDVQTAVVDVSESPTRVPIYTAKEMGRMIDFYEKRYDDLEHSKQQEYNRGWNDAVDELHRLTDQ